MRSAGTKPRWRSVRAGTVLWWVVVAALAVAVRAVGIDGATGAATQSDPAAQATATREAELAELEALKTQVAELQTQVAEACVEPTPTVEPTPVPPVAAGQPLPYAGDWTVVVVGASSRPTVGSESATGTFVEVALSITSHGNHSRSFPLLDLFLLDAQGRTYLVDPVATTRLDPGWALGIDPNLPAERRIIFDVAADSSQPFILASETDPTFRVEVTLAVRG